MYLRAKYTKYKMAKTKFSIWRYVICEICKKNGSNRPFLASRVADTIFPPPIEGHHRQLDNQCKDPMDKTKDCRVGQLTSKELNDEINKWQSWVCLQTVCQRGGRRAIEVVKLYGCKSRPTTSKSKSNSQFTLGLQILQVANQDRT